MAKLTIEIGQFAAQVGRPSMETVFIEHGFEYRFWDIKDLENYNYTSESLYKQHRLYVKSVLFGSKRKFSDDLGYIDMLTGEIVARKPRFEKELNEFVALVENSFITWKAAREQA